MKSRKNDFFRGKRTEEKFRAVASDIGYDVVKSDLQTDIKKHIDFFLTKDEVTIGVDVKGNNKQEEIWCEFKNVGGNDGWMYGEADIIAFDMPSQEYFCVVDREELLSLCEFVVSDNLVYNKSEAFRNKYQRKGRKDQITRMTEEDISSLVSFSVWEYTRDFS